MDANCLDCVGYSRAIGMMAATPISVQSNSISSRVIAYVRVCECVWKIFYCDCDANRVSARQARLMYVNVCCWCKKWCRKTAAYIMHLFWPEERPKY